MGSWGGFFEALPGGAKEGHGMALDQLASNRSEDANVRAKALEKRTQDAYTADIALTKADRDATVAGFTQRGGDVSAKPVGAIGEAPEQYYMPETVTPPPVGAQHDTKGVMRPPVGAIADNSQPPTQTPADLFGGVISGDPAIGGAPKTDISAQTVQPYQPYQAPPAKKETKEYKEWAKKKAAYDKKIGVWNTATDGKQNKKIIGLESAYFEAVENGASEKKLIALNGKLQSQRKVLGQSVADTLTGISESAGKVSAEKRDAIYAKGADALESVGQVDDDPNTFAVAEHIPGTDEYQFTMYDKTKLGEENGGVISDEKLTISEIGELTSKLAGENIGQGAIDTKADAETKKVDLDTKIVDNNLTAAKTRGELATLADSVAGRSTDAVIQKEVKMFGDQVTANWENIDPAKQAIIRDLAPMFLPDLATGAGNSLQATKELDTLMRQGIVDYKLPSGKKDAKYAWLKLADGTWRTTDGTISQTPPE